MALTDAEIQAVQRDITQTFENTANAATPFYPRVCQFVPSSSLDEKYGWLGNNPGMREWVGDRQFKQLRAANYTLTNKPWESSLELERFAVDDDRHQQINMQVKQLANEASYHPDELLADIINTAESNTCFDGQFFYDTDHSWGDSGTQDNDLSYTVVSTSAVTVAEFKAAYEQAVIALLGFKNDQGKFLNRPVIGSLGNVVVRVPVALYPVAYKCFEQAILSTNEDNVHFEKPTVIPFQYMGAGFTGASGSTGSDVKFDVDYLGGMLKPFVFQAREPLRFQAKGGDDIEHKTIKAMTEARYNVGYLAWWTSVRTTLSV